MDSETLEQIQTKIAFLERAAEQQNAIGRSIESFVGPCLGAFLQWLAVAIDDSSLLDDGRNSTLREKCGIECLAGADAIGLAGSRAYDPGIRRAMHRG